MRKWLKEIRIQQGLTQESVATSAGIERAYYTMIENGTRDPSVSVSKSIGVVLGFNWTIFFEDKGNETLPNKEKEVI